MPRAALHNDVLIPVVGRRRGVLIRATALDEAPPAHAAGLDPSVSGLLEFGLYQAGQTALSALRRFSQSKPWWRWARPAFLTIVNPGDVTGLAPENARSAELGLALACAMHRAQSAVPEVIASGCLDPASARSGVEVQPVSLLKDKLGAIAEEYAQAGAPKYPPLLILPTHDPDGASVSERYQEQIALFEQKGIRTVLVRTLAEALEAVSAQKTAPHPLEPIVKRAAVLVAVLTIFIATLLTLAQRPVLVRFVPAVAEQGRVALSPLTGVLSPDGSFAPRSRCSQGASRVVEGAAIAIRFTLDVPPVVKLRGVDLFVIVAGTRTGVKLRPYQIAQNTSLSHDAHGLIAEVSGPEEDNLLSVVATPRGKYSQMGLHTMLTEHIQPLDHRIRLSAVENMLKDLAPGAVFHRFRTVQEADLCE